MGIPPELAAQRCSGGVVAFLRIYWEIWQGNMAALLAKLCLFSRLSSAHPPSAAPRSFPSLFIHLRLPTLPGFLFPAEGRAVLIKALLEEVGDLPVRLCEETETDTRIRGSVSPKRAVFSLPKRSVWPKNTGAELCQPRWISFRFVICPILWLGRRFGQNF